MLVPDVSTVVVAHKIGCNLPRGQNKPDKLHSSYFQKERGKITGYKVLSVAIFRKKFIGKLFGK